MTRSIYSQALAPLVCLFSTTLLFVAADGSGIGQLVNDKGCDCYLTNGSNSAYYTEHRFYDFRNLSAYSGLPSLITDQHATESAQNTSEYFASAEWNSAWTCQNFNNSRQVANGRSPVLMIYSPNNVYIEHNADLQNNSTTYLTLRTARQKGFQSAAEIKTVSRTYHYVSVRFMARTHGSAGAVTALFTYLETGPTATDLQEADLEIRTRDPPDIIKYTNQPGKTKADKDIPEAMRYGPTPNGLRWTDWAVYRFDWTPTQTKWYVNGQEAANISFQVPQDPAPLVFNAWGNGGTFMGNMTMGGEAFLNIQWIDMVFNNTRKVAPWTDSPPAAAAAAAVSKKSLVKKENGCTKVCSIDQTAELGVAELLSTNTAADRGGRSGALSSLVISVLLTFSAGLF